MELVQCDCAIIGDSGVGITTLIEEISPELHNAIQRKDGKRLIEFTFLDITGDIDRLHTYTYKEMEVIAIAFSLVDLESFQNVKEKWHPQVVENCPPGFPVILVGTKKDLRDGRTEGVVTKEQGKTLANEINVNHYLELECTTETKEGLNEFLDLVFSYRRKPSACCLL